MNNIEPTLQDINTVFSQHGFNNCYDNRNWYSFRMRVSFNGLQLIIQNMSNLNKL